MRLALLLAAAVLAYAARADIPVIEGATATRAGAAWTVSATVRHADEGWEHYADGWEVALPDGTVLGHRRLLHPHVAEQPFTRSLPGVAIPEGTAEVVLRAHDNVHGWGGAYVLALR